MAELTKSSRITRDLALSMTRGDDVEWTFVHEMGTSAAIQQITFQIVDSNDVVKTSIALDTAPTQFDIATENECTLQIKHENTRGLDPTVAYKYAVEMIDNSSLRYTPYVGSFTLRDDIVDDGLTSPSASWETRQDLETEIDTLEAEIASVSAIFSVSALSAAASSGASSVVLLDASIVSGTDTIRIETDSGYENHTVLSVVSNTVNLDGTTLGDDAAAGNAAAKVV